MPKKKSPVKIASIPATDLAWAAGFIEADGCTTTSGSSYRIQITQSGLKPPPQLVRLADIFDQNVNGPYENKTGYGRKPVYQVSLQGGKARWAIRLLSEYMTQGGPKLEKALSDLAKAKESDVVKINPRERISA